MPAKHAGVTFVRRHSAVDLVDRFEYAFRRRRATRRLAAVHLIPDLAVMRIRLLEQTDRRRRDVVDPQTRNHACEIRNRAMVDIGPAAIFKAQVYLHTQRAATTAAPPLVGLGKAD